MGLDLRLNFVSVQYLENNWTEFHQILYMHSYIDKIYVGIVTHHFLHIYTRVMALNLLQNFISSQYLENKWTDFDQSLYSYLY